MTAFSHGGDWRSFEERTGARPLDFSANLSPLGLPSGVRTALKAALDEGTCFTRYPDPFARRLRAALANRLAIPDSWICCGAGAADLIYRCTLAFRPKRALILAPTFSEYADALTLAGTEIAVFPLQEANGFAPDESLLYAVDESIDLVVLCEPNNPTGVLTPRPLLARIVDRCRELGVTLVIDESFIELTDEPDARTSLPWLATNPQLVILRSFTKLYGMAGIRLGYALCADERRIEELRAAGPPWNVSTLAQVAGVAALEDCEYEREVRALIGRERPRLATALRELGFNVVDGAANFLLFQSAEPLVEPLAQRGILLRSCANFEGLDATWYRAAVRTAAENAQLIVALREVVGL